MRFLNPIFRGVSIETPPFLTDRNLKSRLFIIGLPIIFLVLIVVFFFAAWNVKNILDRAITRKAQTETRAMGFALESMLVEARDDLLLLASGPVGERDIRRWLESRPRDSGVKIREVAFMGLEPEDRYILLNHDGGALSVPPQASRDARGAPLHGLRSGASHERGQVGISRPMEISYPMIMVNGSPQTLAFHVLRFSAPVYEEGGQFKGMLSLSLDLASMRERLSLFSTMENGGAQSFFFDEDGWMLFQAEAGSGDSPLSSDLARAGFSGDFGRPGFSRAFRPAPEHLNYWTMVSDAQNGKSGILREPLVSASLLDSRASGGASYAPVSFQTGMEQPPQIIGGVALLDESLSAAEPWRRLWLVFSLAFMAAFALLLLALWFMAAQISRKLRFLCGQIEKRNEENSDEPLRALKAPLEFECLRESVNALLGRLAKARSATKNQAAARNRQWLSEPSPDLPKAAHVHVSALVGHSEPMLALYDNIRKAARVNADVLVVGETGTGKELVANAIHRLSERANGPFISINCGALDEALLMDTLFGHVKGAFTEARAERKGAFLAARGGTLMLDEIGNAAPKVQQALLRALSTRFIRPLGSDADIPFNTRIIAATNAPLLDEGGSFRTDLYYRLAVITIKTPPLRDRLEDIPELVAYFLRQAAADAGQSGNVPSISRGALEKLKNSAWPGNVRELKNVITRATAFCDGKLIMAGDLRLEESPQESPDAENGIDIPDSGKPPLPEAIFDMLNPRQRRLWSALQSGGSVSRQEYQELAGENISSRTAQYDLKFMVGLGLLRPEGRGPSQRYMAMFPRPV